MIISLERFTRLNVCVCVCVGVELTEKIPSEYEPTNRFGSMHSGSGDGSGEGQGSLGVLTPSSGDLALAPGNATL